MKRNWCFMLVLCCFPALSLAQDSASLFGSRMDSKSAPGPNQVLDSVVPLGPATPTQQLAGDLFQILNPNFQDGTAAYGQPANVLAQTKAGVWGMDEGACTLFPDNRIFCLYGDTISTFWDSERTQWDDFQFSTTCPSNGGITDGTSSCLGLKAMSLIPAVGGMPADPSACQAIPEVDHGLTQGRTPMINYSGCWTPTYITNSQHLPGSQPAMASQTIHDLRTDADGIPEVITAGHTPNTVFVYNGDLYVEWTVTRKGLAVNGHGGYEQEGVMLECGPAASITTVMSSELGCTKTSVWSQAPRVLQGQASVSHGSRWVTWTSGDSFQSYMTTRPGGTGSYPLIWVDTNNQQEYVIMGFLDTKHIIIDPPYIGAGGGAIGWNVMQHQETNIGKFVDSTASLFSRSDNYFWWPQLPQPLQSLDTVLCNWGSSWAWRQSNVYLMCMDPAAIEGGTYTFDPSRVNGSSGGLESAYYLTGINASGDPVWTIGAENQAIALLTSYDHTVASKFAPDPNGEVSFNIGKPSVRYSPLLKRFVLTYGSAETQGLKIRTALNPWGPWSSEEVLLPNGGHGSWASKMVAPISGGYRFNLSLPFNAPVACHGCTNQIATNVMFESTRPDVQVSATDFPTINDGGNWYAPYQYPVEHLNPDGTVSLYFHASAFNPYVPFDFTVQMSNGTGPGGPPTPFN